MSLRVGDNVFVDGMYPAKIVAFVGSDCCQVAWATEVKRRTVVSCSNVQSMFAEPTRRRRRPTQTYFEETSRGAKKEMEAKQKQKERVAAVKKERTSLKETTREPRKKVERTEEPQSRKAEAAQIMAADLHGPRRSRRRRCEPTIKNESKKDEKLAPRNKKSKVAAQHAKSAREPRTCKTDAVGSTTNLAASTHNFPHGESDASSEGTDATFEYTAPHVDPEYRSRHFITSMELFMSVEPWKQPPQGSCDEQKDGDKEPPASPNTTAKATVARAAIQLEGTPKVSKAMRSPPVYAERRGLGVPRLWLDTPSSSESECHVMIVPAASFSSPWSPTEAKAQLDESTETANPDEIPDIIFAYSDSEKQHNERRITADPAEMSQMFASIVSL